MYKKIILPDVKIQPIKFVMICVIEFWWKVPVSFQRLGLILQMAQALQTALQLPKRYFQPEHIWMQTFAFRLRISLTRNGLLAKIYKSR